MTEELYIGLMSGTSMDGVDAALVGIDGDHCTIKGTVFRPYPADLHQRLESLVAKPHETDLAEIGALHARVATAFGAAVNDLLDISGIDAADVTAVGSHGQTVFHHPEGPDAFSMQLGDPGRLAAMTGIPVVADFRNADIALGGQGAPLVPAFHRWVFGAPGADRAIINIGGIANITLLHSDGATTGFDTGPGNCLLDLWHNENRGEPYDDSGKWAASGSVDSTLLDRMRADTYFSMTPPKSTGRDYFNLDWIHSRLGDNASSGRPEDVQATLSELTALEIAAAVQAVPNCGLTAICGGGAHNTDLRSRISAALPGCAVETTAALGIDPDWVESAAFAWLARQRVLGIPANIPAVTGAGSETCLGGIFLPPAG